MVMTGKNLHSAAAAAAVSLSFSDHKLVVPVESDEEERREIVLSTIRTTMGARFSIPFHTAAPAHTHPKMPSLSRLLLAGEEGAKTKTRG
jgi:hypothetical protein